MRFASLIGPELEALLRESQEVPADVLAEIHPEDVADIIDQRDDETAAVMLLALPQEYAAQVFERLDEDRQEALAERIGVRETATIAKEMDTDDLADFLSHAPPALGEKLLESLGRVDPEFVEEVRELRQWPDTSAGGLMTKDFIALDPGGPVSDAIEEIRQLAEDAETVDTIFVTEGDDDKLLGVLTLRQMLLAKPWDTIDVVMRQNVISVPPELDQEDVARKLAKYDLNTLPVVSDGGELLGVITSDDILDVLTEEQSEDVQKMAAVEPMRDGYFDTTLPEIIRKRITWLVILFFGGFLTTLAMKEFDVILASVTALALYLPLLISAGGNSGSQSASLIIRGLAVGDITWDDWWRVLLREVTQGAVLGSTLGLIGAGWALLNSHGQIVALLIGLSIVGLVLLGCVIGGMMPLILHRLGIDPATSSTPFIASLVDVFGILLYLGLAVWLLGDVIVAPEPESLPR